MKIWDRLRDIVDLLTSSEALGSGLVSGFNKGYGCKSKDLTPGAVMLGKVKQQASVILWMLAFPEIVCAKAGLAELEGPASVVVPLFFLLASFTVPLSLVDFWGYSWQFRLLQLPLIVIVLFLTATRLRKWKAKKLKYFLILPPLYGMLILSTNFAGTAYFQADHSDYFPKEREMNRLFQRGTQQERPLRDNGVTH